MLARGPDAEQAGRVLEAFWDRRRGLEGATSLGARNVRSCGRAGFLVAAQV